MEKKFFISLAMALLPLSSSFMYGEPVVVPLQVTIEDPHDGHGNENKSPVEPPYVWQEGYTFTFDESCLGCTLRLVDDSDTVVYTTVITSDTVVLPSTFSGNYELQVIRGIWCFYGFIEL